MNGDYLRHYKLDTYSDIFGEIQVKTSVATEIIKWFCFFSIFIVYFWQISVFFVMTFVLEFEWILSLFISSIYLLFPTLAMIFLFNLGLQKNLLTPANTWSIWFAIIFQLTVLIMNDNMLTGQFADYFKLQKSIWTNLLVVV